MATDATGTPSTNFLIPKYLTSADAPSGKGLNAIVDYLDSLLVKGFAALTSKGDIVYASAANTAARLPVGSTGQVLTVASGAPSWADAPGAVTLRKNTSRAVNTTTAATDLLNGEITLPAITATGFVRVTMWGDWINNVGTAQVPPRFQVVLGATTLLDTSTTTTSYNSDATRREWLAYLTIAPSNATNAQLSYLRIAMSLGTQAVGPSNFSFTTGHGGGIPTSTAAVIENGGNQTTVDMSVANLLKFNVINGNAGAAYETKLLGALVEII